jgi:diaminopimelate decarboxylase
MGEFHYKQDSLHCEGVSIEKLARTFGTPFYLYSHAALIGHYDVFDRAFRKVPHILCFAVKANSNLAVLNTMARRGGGADIVTGGELYRALQAGVPSKKIVFSGVGKSEDELAYALRSRIHMFNVESSDELTALDRVASRLRKKAPVALRVNPNIDPKTHPYISTGMKKSKFGIQVNKALELYQGAKRFKNINFIGVSCHIGSQITQVKPFVDALEKVAPLIKKLRQQGLKIENLDIGGGLGICYDREKPPVPEAYARAMSKTLQALDVTVICEPGRSIAGNAGIFVTKVLYNKVHGTKHFVIVDAAMNDLVRPSLYGSYHDLKPVKKSARKKVRVDVVGPICESGDFIAKDRLLPSVKNGELIAAMSAGAYGFTMSSNYNSRPRVPEIMVRGKKYDVIRRRESLSDLIRGEKIPRGL